jgi:hypothetical protein
MSGDDKVRFCSMCELNVYNISNMTTKEAGQIIRKKEGKLCVQLRRRRDGTVITENCPVGLRKLRDTFRRCAVLAISVVCWLGLAPQAARAKSKCNNSAAAIAMPRTDTATTTPYSTTIRGRRYSPELLSDTNGTIGGGASLSYFTEEELRKEKAAEERKKVWMLSGIVTLGVSAVYLLGRKRSRSIVSMAIICSVVVALTGLSWGLVSAGWCPPPMF